MESCDSTPAELSDMRAYMPVAGEWYKAMVLDVIVEGCMVHECGAMIMMAVGSLGGTHSNTDTW